MTDARNPLIDSVHSTHIPVGERLITGTKWHLLGGTRKLEDRGMPRQRL